MTSRQRMLAALSGQKPDCLPVTTHHIMPSYLARYEGGITAEQFFDKYGFDAIDWTLPHACGAAPGDRFDPAQGEPGFLQSRRIISDQWRITEESLPQGPYQAVRYTVHTPGGQLTCTLESNEHTSWVTEHLIKEKRDIELLARYQTAPLCDREAVEREARRFGDRGIIRGHIPSSDIFGQPGCWQDACCLYGTERLIMETYDDPQWVHEFLSILQARKLTYIRSLSGAPYDILELGGGDGCLSVISPAIFRTFVAPYDSVLIRAAHDAGQRITYHLCGKLMGILEDVAAMEPDAVETFTPAGMGADADLALARKLLGTRICMIGGFDQYHFFTGCSEAATRAEVRRCFDATGGIGYILAPSDHFFEAEERLLRAFVDEARRCIP